MSAVRVAVRAVLRRARERGVRTLRWLGRVWRARTRRRLRVAAGSTPRFPAAYHAFVSELTSMHELLGADVKLFHTEHGQRHALAAEFRCIDDNRELVRPAWEVHRADYEHYRRTRAKVDALLAELTKHSGTPREGLEQNFDLMLAFTVARRHAAWGADYVHTAFFYNQALCGLVSGWLNGIPRGLTAYADHMLADWPLKVVALHLQTAAVIVATSRRIRDELLAIGGMEIAAKVIVKPNGVDGRRFRFVARGPVRGRCIELVCVARIEPKKGLMELAEAARVLRDRGLAVRFHVVGAVEVGNASSEDYGARFERRVQELGVGDLVIRHGRLAQPVMLPLLAAADAFVAPFVELDGGDKDGIPTAILEAMATGLPIVGTVAGSIAEVFDDGVEGLRVAQHDPMALADAIARLIAEPELAPSLGVRARSRFERDFDIRVVEPRLHARIVAAVGSRAHDCAGRPDARSSAR